MEKNSLRLNEYSESLEKFDFYPQGIEILLNQSDEEILKVFENIISIIERTVMLGGESEYIKKQIRDNNSKITDENIAMASYNKSEHLQSYKLRKILMQSLKEKDHKSAKEILVLLVHYIGLINETAEFMEKIINNSDMDVSNDEIEKEKGDMYWYATRLDADLELDPERILQSNYTKLVSRLERNKIQGNGDHR